MDNKMFSKNAEEKDVFFSRFETESLFHPYRLTYAA